MKKILTIIIIAIFSLSSYARKDVTKFLGIPVEGTKDEMIQKLKEKGFKTSAIDKDFLEGEFNGRDVRIQVVTNNNKVYRIVVTDVSSSDESGIKIRFNKLCQQFNKNDKYISSDDYTIEEDEDISFEISAHAKRYQALFKQKPDMSNPLDISKIIAEKAMQKYSLEQLNNPTDEINQYLMDLTIETVDDICNHKLVWFMIIQDRYDEYRIAMFYDNEYNHADGEDL